MMCINEIAERIFGQWTVDALLETLGEITDDFSELRSNYLLSISKLTGQLESSAIVSVEELEEALCKQMRSDLLFSGILGLKANFDHFINPVANDFLDKGYDVFLREEIAHSLPEYVKAQETEALFISQLSKKQKSIYESITEYTAYLETIGPKLAHYYGYLLGNTLLYQIIPGYYPNHVQTMRYKQMLQTYLGD